MDYVDIFMKSFCAVAGVGIGVVLTASLLHLLIELPKRWYK